MPCALSTKTQPDSRGLDPGIDAIQPKAQAAKGTSSDQAGIKQTVAAILESLAKHGPPSYLWAMNCDQALAILRAHEAELRAAGIEHLSIFGSMARGEAGGGSDVDVVVRLTPEASKGGFAYFGRLDDLTGRLEEMLGCSVDLARGRACLLASGSVGSRISSKTSSGLIALPTDGISRRLSLTSG
jgi:predicted nucleotidyltransferase